MQPDAALQHHLRREADDVERRTVVLRIENTTRPERVLTGIEQPFVGAVGCVTTSCAYAVPRDRGDHDTRQALGAGAASSSRQG